MAIITISRQLGSLGNEIAHELAEDLNYQLLSKEMISNMLLESGFSEKKSIKSFSAEEKPSFLSSFVLDRDRFLCYVKKALYEFALQQNVIIMGMGGQSLFHNFANTLCVRVIAPMDVRKQRVQDKFSCDKHYAEHLIHDSDHARSGFNKYFFTINWQDVSLYDLIINTKSISLKGAMKLIKEGLQELEKKEQEQEMAKKLEDLVLKQKVFIAILSKKEIHLPYVSVEVKDDIVTLSGWTDSTEEKEDCEAAARKVPGVKEVVNDIFIKLPRI